MLAVKKDGKYHTRRKKCEKMVYVVIKAQRQREATLLKVGSKETVEGEKQNEKKEKKSRVEGCFQSMHERNKHTK